MALSAGAGPDPDETLAPRSTEGGGWTRREESP
jgi:hypothetical protein